MEASDLTTADLAAISVGTLIFVDTTRLVLAQTVAQGSSFGLLAIPAIAVLKFEAL